MSSVKHTTLFGFPVMIQKIDQKSYNKKSIISTIEKNFKLNKKRNRWDKQSVLHHAYKDFNNPNSKFQTIDLKNNIIIPGFIDSHFHLKNYGKRQIKTYRS